MNALTVNELHFTYPGASEETLHGLSFDIAEGEILGFLGPSGAGKSTTQKILISLLKGYRGSVTVLGRELIALAATTTIPSASRSSFLTTT